MDDLEGATLPVGGAMGGVQAFGDGAGDVHRQRDGHLATLLSHPLEHAAERDAVEELHHDEVRLALLSEVLDVDDVRVADERREPRFLEEETDELVVDRELLVDDLEHHVALEAAGPVLARHVEAAHPALRQVRQNAVATELCAGPELHPSMVPKRWGARGEPTEKRQISFAWAAGWHARAHGSCLSRLVLRSPRNSCPTGHCPRAPTLVAVRVEDSPWSNKPIAIAETAPETPIATGNWGPRGPAGCSAAPVRPGRPDRSAS